jgi:hypothetical protein
MTMTYAELVTNVSDIVENEFTTAQIDMFIGLAEQAIYNTVHIPALRKEDTTIATVDGTDTITLPSDFLYMYSFAVINASSEYVYMLEKDANFIHEAYPVNATDSFPKHYGILNATTLILGPTPDAIYSTELQYGYYPESIVTASTTWLGNEFDSALLNGTLIEAARFLKLEQDTIALYTEMYTQSMKQLRNLGTGKLRGDMYRSGETRVEVK